MTKLTNFKKGLLGTVAIAVLSTGTAFADGTAAGSLVSNIFTLDYDVNGAEQPQINNNSNPTDFLVDRLIDLTVTGTATPVSVAPGQENAITTFTLTNDGNGTQAYDLSLEKAGPRERAAKAPHEPNREQCLIVIPGPALALYNSYAVLYITKQKKKNNR